jgi:hypothetical protein
MKLRLTVATLLAVVAPAWAQVQAVSKGCCCVAQGKAYTCSEMTQADCLARQPAAPTFPKMADWKKAWSDAVAASEVAEAGPLRGGWIAGACEK